MIKKRSNSTAAQVRTDYDTRDAYVYRRGRRKADWAGMGLGDAFKPSNDYFAKMTAQRLFYSACGRIQQAAARLAGEKQPGLQAKVKPQLGPCFTTYPSNVAAHAAVGLTGFLEFQARLATGALQVRLSEYLKNPAAADAVLVNPEIYQRLATIVTRCVQTRLLLEDLSRHPSMSLVELFRMFSASQQSLKFGSLPEILNAVILFGDILPDWHKQVLHPLTRALLLDLSATCRRAFDEMAVAKPQHLAEMGATWVRAVCTCLAKYLPMTEEAKQPAGHNAGPQDSCGFAKSQDPSSPASQIAPLDGPNPPSLFEPPSAAEQISRAMSQGRSGTRMTGDDDKASEEAQEAAKLIQEFGQAAAKAGDQEGQWQDMRSDLVERAMRTSGFSESPIQGAPTDGHEVKVWLGDESAAGGEVYDRPVELSDDFEAYRRLLETSKPIADALRRTLYPNLDELPEVERFRTCGAMDPARLPLADCSAAIFRRLRIHQRADRRGQPVLLIACDGSGSLNRNQMQMLRTLTAAWLTSTARSRIQLLAGLYHSGLVRGGLSGPLIQWIYHPRKTPTTSRMDAARAIVSLPNEGTGAQSDALSISFMLEEARRMARGRMIYLILISDCAWNRSFHTQRTGKEEVYGLFEAASEEFLGRLHTTLVALGVQGETGFETLLDKVILVPESKLCNPSAVAEEIGLYVASRIKEGRRLVAAR